MPINPLTGMADEPGQSYSIASRLSCGKCGGTPKIIKAEGTDTVIIEVTCCGFKESRSIARAELTFQQVFFNDR